MSGWGGLGALLGVLRRSRQSSQGPQETCPWEGGGDTGGGPFRSPGSSVVVSCPFPPLPPLPSPLPSFPPFSFPPSFPLLLPVPSSLFPSVSLSPWKLWTERLVPHQISSLPLVLRQINDTPHPAPPPCLCRPGLQRGENKARELLIYFSLCRNVYWKAARQGGTV